MIAIRIIFTLEIILIGYLLCKAYTNKNILGKKLTKLLMSILVGVLTYSVNVNMKYPRYEVLSFFNSLQLISIDIMLFQLIEYLYEYLDMKHIRNKHATIFLKFIIAIDSVLLLLNPFKEIVLTYEYYDYRGIRLLKHIPKNLYYLHMGICYSVIVLAFIMLLVKCINTPITYWYRYILLLVCIFTFNAGNSLALYSRNRIDISILCYGAIAVVLYFITISDLPSTFLTEVYKTMLSCMEQPMILFDYNHKFVDCNDDIKKIFPEIDFEKNQYTLQSFAEDSNIDELSKLYNESISFQWNNTRHDAHKMYECKCIFLENEKKVPQGILICFHDITTLMNAWKAEHDAIEANRAKSSFLARMSHEIRTPINAILGMDELIMQESTEAPIIEYASAIESSGKMLLSLINDILDFSKIESGKIDIINNEYRVSSLMNDLIQMAKVKAEKKKLELEVEMDENMPDYLFGDEIRIGQIVTNLLSNAIKYTDKGKVKIAIGYRLLARAYKKASSNHKSETRIELQISVEDTGRGISKTDQRHLFESFQRGDLKYNRSIEGTGLGLAITKNLIELMNGRIEYTSKLGHGSIFTVYIPQVATNDVPIGDFKKNFEISRLGTRYYKSKMSAPGANILLVDDNVVNLMVEEKMLAQMQINIDTCERGMEAIEKLKKKSYDLIFLDHMMPELDGIETLQKMKENNLLGDTPVIVLTANAISGAREMYLEAGFQDYIPKPVSGKNFEKILTKWLPSYIIKDTKTKENKAASEETLKKLEKISNYLNVFDVVRYSVNGIDGMLQTIEIFCQESERSRKRIVDAYEHKDYYAYQISVHALKSGANLIGADELVKMTKKLEQACKDGNIEFVQENHNLFIEQYDKIVRNLKLDMQQEMNQEKMRNDKDKMEQQKLCLNNIELAAKEWDTVRVAEEMKRLESLYDGEEMTKEEEKQKNALIEAFDNVNYEQLVLVLEKFKKMQHVQ